MKRWLAVGLALVGLAGAIYFLRPHAAPPPSDGSRPAERRASPGAATGIPATRNLMSTSSRRFRLLNRAPRRGSRCGERWARARAGPEQEPLTPIDSREDVYGVLRWGQTM